MSLSVVITSYNSQQWIKDCITSVKFADEIIVVDNGSTDDTVKIAKQLGATVFSFKNNPRHLNESKNYGFTKASKDWILSLDTDERVEEDLHNEIQRITSNLDSDIPGYEIPRHNVIFGKIIKHGLWYPDYQIRLFKRGQGKFPNVHNHELLKVAGKVEKLKGHILHYNYQTISQYIQKIDKQYSDNEVETFLAAGRKIKWSDAIKFPFQDFISNYFARQAYKDGLHGLVLSLLQAFYMFIVFAKIWEKQGFKEQQIKLEDSYTELTSIWKQIVFWNNQEKLKVMPLPKKLLMKIYYKFKNL